MAQYSNQSEQTRLQRMKEWFVNLTLRMQVGVIVGALVFVAGVVLAVVGGPGAILGVRLHLSPDEAAVTSGDTFDVDVLLDTAGQDIAAVSAFLTFDETLFDLSCIAPGNCADIQVGPGFGTTAELQRIGNSINIVTGTATPVNGTGQVVATITFTVRDDASFGTGVVDFDTTNSAVIISDGFGTDILAEVQNGTYTVGASGGLSITQGPSATVDIPTPPPVLPPDVTIEWNTNIESDSTVYYGTQSCPGCSLPDFIAVNSGVVSDPTPTTAHSISLPGLAPDTAYVYRVLSQQGVLSVSSLQNSFFTADISQAPQPLRIFNLSADPDVRSAVVTWSTNKLSDSSVTITSPAGGTFDDPTVTLSHSVKLSNLLPLTDYEVRVESELSDGTESAQAIVRFRTLPEDLTLDSNIVLKARRDRVCAAWLECTSSIPVTNLEGFREELCFDVALCNELGPDGECAQFTRQTGAEQVYTVQGGDPEASSIENARNLSGYSLVGARWASGGAGNADFFDTVVSGSIPLSRMQQQGSSLTVPNGDFESGNTYPWVARWFEPRVQISDLSLVQNVNDRSDIQRDENRVLSFVPSKQPSSDVAGVKVSLGKTVRDGVQYYVSMDVMTGDPAADELIVQFGFQNYRSFQPYATEFVSVTPGWQRVIVGPFEVATTDLPSVGEETFLGILYDTSRTLGPYQPFFLDNIAIHPVLQVRPETYITKSCRSYASADSPACNYYDVSTGREFQGWEGYCVETDPRNEQRCIQWLPIDMIAGSQSIRSSSVRVGYGADGEVDRFPLYYCLEASGKDSYYEHIIRTNALYCDGRCRDQINTYGAADLNILNEGIKILRDEIIEVKLHGIQMDHDADGSGFDCEIIAPNPPSTASGNIGTIVFNEVNEAHWSDGVNSGSKECDGGTSASYNEHAHLYCSKEGQDNECNVVTASLEFDSQTDELTGIIVKYRDANDRGFLGAGSGGRGTVGDITITYRGGRCETIAQVVDPLGETVAYTNRIQSDAYAVPLLGYQRGQDFAPFGSVVAPAPVHDPTQWDSDDGAPDKQPLYVEPPDKARFPGPQYQARAGSPYGVTPNSELMLGTCIEGGRAGLPCSNHEQCAGNIGFGHCAGVTPPPSIPEAQYLAALNTTTNGGAILSNLFARSTGVWTWDFIQKQYRPVCSNSGVCVDTKCYGGINEGSACVPGVTVCDGGGTCIPEQCIGGINNGDPCISDAECSGGTCAVKTYGWDTTANLSEGITNVCSVGRVGAVCNFDDDCDVFSEGRCENRTICIGGFGGSCFDAQQCVGGPNDGLICLSDADCGVVETEGICSVGGSGLYPSDLKPPSVSNMRLTAGSFDSLKDPRGDLYLVNGQGGVSFSFNSTVGANQLPLVRYTVEWDDGRISEESSLKINHKSQENDPHILSHTYFCDDVNGDGDVTAADYPAANWDSTLGACVFRPRVEIADNWGWCSGSLTRLGSPIEYGFDNYAGSTGHCVGGTPGNIDIGKSCVLDNQCDGGAGVCVNSPSCDSWDVFQGRIIVCPETTSGSSCNQNPNAVISPTSVSGVVPQTVNFSGAGSSDTDGFIQSWSWSFPGGSPATGSGAGPIPVTYNTPGSYTATLTVTDDAGGADTAPASVTVTPISLTVSAGTGSMRAGNQVEVPISLSGVRTQPYTSMLITIDYDPTIVQYDNNSGVGTLTDGWPMLETGGAGTITIEGSNTGGSDIITDGVLRNLTFTGVADGTTTLNVSVATIGPGAPSVTLVSGSVTVSPTQPPTIVSYTHTPNNVAWPVNATFTVTIDDPDGEWPVDLVLNPDRDGAHPTALSSLSGQATLASPTVVLPMIQTYDVAGTYVAELTATNAAGVISTDLVTVTITDNNPPVITNFRFNQTNAPTALPVIGNFTADITDPEGDYDITYSIDFGDSSGSGSLTLSSPGGAIPAVNKTYNATGNYTATITATDSRGNSSTPVTTTVPVDWWDANFKYRRQINVLNDGFSGTLPTEFPVQAIVDTQTLISAGKMLSDGSDLRIVRDNGSAILSEIDRHVIDINTASSFVWFRTKEALSPSGGDNKYWLYYGYDGPGSPSAPAANLGNVFQPATDGNTVAVYYFEEGSGTSIVDSQNGINGSASGGQLWQAGRFGRSLHFNDTQNHRVLVGHDGRFESGAGTVEFWARVEGTNREQGLFSKDHLGTANGGHLGVILDNGTDADPAPTPYQIEYRIQRLLPTELSMYLFSDDSYADADLPLQWGPPTPTSPEWAHIAVVWAPDSLELYVNGVLQTNDPFGHSSVDTQGTTGNQEVLWLGAATLNYDSGIGESSLGPFLNGRLDGFRWSNTARSSFPYAAVSPSEDPSVIVDPTEDDRDVAYLLGATRVAGVSTSNLKRGYGLSGIIHSLIAIWSLFAGN